MSDPIVRCADCQIPITLHSLYCRSCASKRSAKTRKPPERVQAKQCPDCGVPITKCGIRCRRCAALRTVKTRKPRIYKGIDRKWGQISAFAGRMSAKYGPGYYE
jgi:hypothetical protein